MSYKKGKLFVVTAPTGAGKTTIVNNLLKQASLPINRVITYTTRPQAPTEVSGKDYHFVTREDFLTKKAQGFFLETTLYNNFLYGSPHTIVNDLNKGKSYIMITDRPGALLVKKIVPQAVIIWITVSDPITLKNRLISRHREEGKQLEQRLALAQEEFETEKAQKNFSYYILNDDSRIAVKSLENIIQLELNQ